MASRVSCSWINDAQPSPTFRVTLHYTKASILQTQNLCFIYRRILALSFMSIPDAKKKLDIYKDRVQLKLLPQWLNIHSDMQHALKTYWLPLSYVHFLPYLWGLLHWALSSLESPQDWSNRRFDQLSAHSTACSSAANPQYFAKNTHFIINWKRTYQT